MKGSDVIVRRIFLTLVSLLLCNGLQIGLFMLAYLEIAIGGQFVVLMYKFFTEFECVFGPYKKLYPYHCSVL